MYEDWLQNYDPEMSSTVNINEKFAKNRIHDTPFPLPHHTAV